MSIEVLPQGVKCPLACEYCYQDPLRRAGNALSSEYDMDKMKAALLAEGYKFTIFGGEALSVPINDLEELWRFGLEKFGETAAAHGDTPNGVQTSGMNMTDDHVRLFQKYKVGVGMSIDGPDELNDARWAGSVERTREATANSLTYLDKLLVIGHIPSLIVTLHRVNASPERLPRLLQWFRDLSAKGLRNVNLHLLEVDSPGVREKLGLTTEENVAALMACCDLQDEIKIAFNPIRDMTQLLVGRDQWSKDAKTGRYRSGTSCTWNACDPYTTDAVHGVDGQGNRGNCGRTCKEGPMWVKASQAGYERYLGLYHAPQEFGGCKGCRFFYACKGHCPGEGERGGDWRSKTEHCSTLMRTFEALEARLIAKGKKPVSVNDELRLTIEGRMVAAWMQGRSLGVTAAQESTQPVTISGNRDHGDAPHGDHTDLGKPVYTHGDHDDEGGW
jgi:uncharacterized protein